MKSYFGSAIIARICVNVDTARAPRSSRRCTLIRLFSSTILARKLPSKPPNACVTATFSPDRAGSAAASVLMASSPSMRPERRALKALDSMGTTCQSRMRRLFGAGAAWPAPGRVGCGRGPPARPPSTDPSCPPSWSTCFWKCSSRRETLTADLARYSARVSSRRFSASFSETREL